MLKSKLLLALCLFAASAKPMEPCCRTSAFLLGGSFGIAGAIGFVHNLGCMSIPGCNINNDSGANLMASVACFIAGAGLLGEALKP